MVHSSGVDIRRYLRVKYVNESGEDVLGVFNDWILKLSHVFAGSRLMFEQFGEEGACMSKQVAGKHTVAYEQLFRFFGRFLGMVLFHNMCIDFRLSKQLIKLIQGYKLSLSDIKDDDGYHKKLQFFVSHEMDRETWEDYFEDWNVIVNEKDQMRKYVALRSLDKVTDPVAYADRKEYAVKMIQHRISRGQWVIDAIRQGINEILPIEWLNAFSTNVLKIMLCGAETPINPNTWGEYATSFMADPPPTESVEHFWHWIYCDASDKDRRDVSCNSCNTYDLIND